MSSRWAIYDDAGRISQIVIGSPLSVATAPFAGEIPQVIQIPNDSAAHPRTHYVADGAVVERPPLAVEIVGRLLVGVPAGAVVSCGMVSAVAAGGNLYLDVLERGPVTVRIDAFPALAWSAEIISDGPEIDAPANVQTLTVTRHATLAAAIDAACAEIDAAAGRVRAATITAVPGQAETYRAKYAEAQAWAGSDTADRDTLEWPWLTAESAALGITRAEAAAGILAAASAWTARGAEIETLRLGGKRAVRAAVSLRGAAINLRAAEEVLL